MGLAVYKRKRRFHRTPEPAGASPKKKAKGARSEPLSFVIQKHAASHLHYDFRLELDGTLKSWAVPKGPSTSTRQKRLAMEVEDHPIEYGGFEGVIPKGEYGGGTVMLWDRGTWSPVGDARDGLRRGKLEFELHGARLKGVWKLVRMKPRDDEDAKKPAWLLMKERDAHADGAKEPVVAYVKSVATKRTMDEIAGAVGKQKKVWHSEEAARTARTPARTVKKRAAVKGAPMPRSISPQLTTLTETAPQGDDWVHEIKLDGYRAVAFLDDGEARLFSRKSTDWTKKLASIVEAVAALPARNAILDGEVCVIDGDGTTSFEALQAALSSGEDRALVYFVFDLLYLDGRDLRREPLLERKRALARLLEEGKTGLRLRFSDHVAGSGAEFFSQACKHGLEGIISKRADATYLEGRSKSWLKTKCHEGQEVVIGGFTSPGGARHGFGALLMGTYGAPGGTGSKKAKHATTPELRYAGKVGTGFTGKALADLHKQLQSLERESSPFVDAPHHRGVTWVEPKLVAQVRFTEWTREGRLRHPTFLGLREDKAANEVGRDVKAGRELKASAVKKAIGAKSAIEVAGVTITHPGRMVDESSGLTKLGLARYFEAVAPILLEHGANRPLSLVRCPDGTAGKCFFQKHRAPGMGSAIHVAKLDSTHGALSVSKTEGLVALAQHSVVELHAWGCTLPDTEHADWLVLDLDPDEKLPFSAVVDGALEARDLLGEIGLESWLKTTGGKGLHVVVPIARRYDWDTVKAFAHAIALAMVRRAPDRYTATMSKSARAGKIFVDYLRNSSQATAVLPYSPRARPNATVAMPILWKDVKHIHPGDFTVANVPGLLKKRRTDPWKGIHANKQTLTKSAATKLTK